MVNSIRLSIDNSIYTRNRGLCFCKQLMWNKQDNLCFDVKPICYKGLERGFLERNKLCKCGYIFILYFTGIGKTHEKKIILTDFREKDVLKYSMSWSCQIKAVVTKQNIVNTLQLENAPLSIYGISFTPSLFLRFPTLL